MQFLLGTIILTIAVFGMAIGVILNRRPLSGSCGGPNQQGSCSLCGGDPNKCEESN
mgnify:CR=1 FL=1